MVIFKYIEDIENWLKPMGYNDFWEEIKSFDVNLPYKPHCDGKIISGQVKEDIMLGGLKYLASIQLGSKLKLKRRPITMPDHSERA